MPVGPGEVALDRLDGEEAAESRRRESQEEGAPEEACSLGGGDGELAGGEPSGCEEMVRRHHERG